MSAPLATVAWYVVAALTEIAGCFAFWTVLRLGRSPAWPAAGLAALVVFAFALTRVETAAAVRAFAAYGGIYIAASLVWLRLVEGVVSDRWDLIGAQSASPAPR